MTDVVTRYLDASFVLAVTGAAMIWPPLALVIAAAYFAVGAFINDRRAPEAKP